MTVTEKEVAAQRQRERSEALAGEAMPDIGPGMEWYRELRDE
jgi:hypothetical protein